jgi:signal transduction histidine kinase
VAAVDGYEPSRWLGTRLPLTISIFERMTAQRQPVILADAAADTAQNPAFAPWEVSAAAPRSWLGASLLIEAEVVGMLVLTASAPNRFSAEQAELVQAFAHQAAAALRQARLFQAMQRRTRELESLTKISTILRSVHTVAEMLPHLAQHTCSASGAATVLLGSLTPSEIVTVQAAGDLRRPKRQAWPLTAHPFGPFLDVQHAQFLAPGAPQPAGWPPRPGDDGGVALLPLRLEHQPLGFIYVEFSAARPLETDAMQMLIAQADLAANALHRASLGETMERRIRENIHELELLYQVASLASRSQSLEESLGQTLALALNGMGCRSGAIHLLTPGEGRDAPAYLQLAAHQGLPPEIAAAVEMLALGEGVTGAVAVSGELTLISHLESEERALFHNHPATSWAKSLVCAPLRAVGGLKGVLTILNPELAFTRPQDLALLTTLADQMGVMVENAQLRVQAEQEAVAAERRRLGRDLHDSVTQALYSVMMLTGAARNLAEAGNFTKVASILGKIEANNQQALREMRLLIYELRPQVLEEEGLVGALQSRLETVEKRAGIAAELHVTGNISLPPAVEAELYRLAQEALNNALKHAAAKQISVRLSQEAAQFALEVCDDGGGFDPQAANGGGQGLTNLRERAALLGADLDIQSSLGAGTCVRVRWQAPVPPAALAKNT